MFKTPLLIILFFSTFCSYAQLNCEKTMECRIIAESGLLMRAKPSLNAKVVTSVPFDTIIEACTSTFGEMSYEKINGHWRKVTHRNKVGYMFDGFLEIVSINEDPVAVSINNKKDTSSLKNTSPGDTVDRNTQDTSTEESRNDNPPKKKIKYSLLTETYNYCGDVSKLNPGLIWYGIYPPKENEPYGRIEEVQVDIVLSKYKLGEGMEFDIQTQKEEKSIFLLGLNQPINLNSEIFIDPSNSLRAIDRRLFPGQEIRLGTNTNYPKLSATGTVKSTGKCPELEDYKLLLKGRKFAIDFEQAIYKDIGDLGECGIPEILWYGDLNGDDFPEIIFVSVSEEKNIFSLFVSDPSHPEKLLVKKSEWIIPNCN